MDREQRRRYQASIIPKSCPKTSFLDHTAMIDGTGQPPDGTDIVNLLKSGQLFIVSQKRNGLIVFKHYYAEFAGPGAIVGGDYDRDCQGAIPIGNLSLSISQSDEYEQRHRAYLLRRQWVIFIQGVTKIENPVKRVQVIINQFKEFFPAEPELVTQLPDIAFAMLVGVLPQTVAMVRRSDGDLDDID